MHTVENENLMNPITRLSMPLYNDILRSSSVNERYKNIIVEEVVNDLDDARVIKKEE